MGSGGFLAGASVGALYTSLYRCIAHHTATRRKAKGTIISSLVKINFSIRKGD
jgi:hypothetical protein